jgi:hypothetical protein
MRMHFIVTGENVDDGLADVLDHLLEDTDGGA